MPRSSTDELLNDYLSDMFGDEPARIEKTDVQLKSEAREPSDAVLSASVSMTNLVNQPAKLHEEARLSNISPFLQENQLAKSATVIDTLGASRVYAIELIFPDLFLIPTIKLLRDADDVAYRSQREAHTILLTFLFYLRKPLSPRVRKCFLDYSEQAIDDYYAAFWLAGKSAESLQ